MTWCILVFSPIRGDLSLEYLEEKVTEERERDPGQLLRLAKSPCWPQVTWLVSLQEGPQESLSLWALEPHAELKLSMRAFPSSAGPGLP